MKKIDIIKMLKEFQRDHALIDGKVEYLSDQEIEEWVYEYKKKNLE